MAGAGQTPSTPPDGPARPAVHTAASIVEDLDLGVPDPSDVLAEITDGTQPRSVRDPGPRPRLNSYLTADLDVETPQAVVAEPVAAEPVAPEPVAPEPAAPERDAGPRARRAEIANSLSPSVQPAAQGSSLERVRRLRLGAISGTVASTRGTGLVGLCVSVVDEYERVVATAVTARDGTFTIDELPIGTYYLKAHDEDGDYTTAWFGGSSYDRARAVKVAKGKTVRKAEFRLMSTTEIDVRVDVGERRLRVKIWVIERGPGLPAPGVVRLTTAHFSNALKLTRGHAVINLPGSPEGAADLIEGLEVHYRGHKHTLPQSYRAKAR